MKNVMHNIARFSRALGVGALIAAAGTLTPGITPAAGAAEPADPVTFGCSKRGQAYVVPDGVTRLFAVLMGGTGGSDQGERVLGGVGGRVDTALDVTPGQRYWVIVGCAGKETKGGQGSTNGGDGGDSGVIGRGDGGGGGGSSAIGLVTPGSPLAVAAVAAGGGGAGGKAGLKEGRPRGVDPTKLHDEQTAEKGWKSKGGGGGGGGGGGWRTGAAGHGGSFAGDYGGGGYEGLSYDSTGKGTVTPGGAPRGDGSVRIFPVNPARPLPNLATGGCADGDRTPYKVPAGVWTVRVRASGATGNGPRPGRGGAIVADVPVRPGQQLSSVVGCEGGTGWANGGHGGDGPHLPGASEGGGPGYRGGGATALLHGDTPLVVAGGGGGSGGDGKERGGGAGGHGGQAGGSASGSGGAGGAGGAADKSDGNNASDGQCGGAGGGGGGGYRGGRGGNAGSCAHGGGGGGGGSSYTEPNATNVRDVGPAIAGPGSIEIIAIPAGAPDAPAAPLISTWGSSVAVYLSAPDDGGAPITSYTVTLQPGGKKVTTSALSVRFYDLPYGVAYTATVVATNDVGASPTSAPSKPVTPVTVPDPPKSVTAKAGPRSAVVSFAPGATNGSPITSYTVVDLKTGKRVTAAKSPVTFAQLQNGHGHAFAVSARNALGEGGFSASNLVTPMQVPSPPWAVTAKPGDGRAVVDFEPPLDLGGAPSTVGYAVYTESGTVVGLGTSSPITVTGLANGVDHRFSVVARTYFGVSAKSGLSVPVTPKAPPAPANDHFWSPTYILGASGSINGTIVNAGRDLDEPDHLGDSAGTSVWYSFSYLQGGSIRFDLCGSTFEGTITAYTGNDLVAVSTVDGGRPIVGCQDGSTSPGLFLDLPSSGGSFKIAIDRRRSAGGAPGTFQLNWKPGA